MFVQNHTTSYRETNFFPPFSMGEARYDTVEHYLSEAAALENRRLGNTGGDFEARSDGLGANRRAIAVHGNC